MNYDPALVPSLLADPSRVADLPLEVVTPLLGDVRRLETHLEGRMKGLENGNGAARRGGEAPEEGDRLLTREEAAPLLGLTVEAFRRRERGFPFRRKLGHRTVRYSEQGISKWLARKRP